MIREDATEFFYSPECAGDRAFWFCVADIPEPSSETFSRDGHDGMADWLDSVIDRRGPKEPYFL